MSRRPFLALILLASFASTLAPGVLAQPTPSATSPRISVSTQLPASGIVDARSLRARELMGTAQGQREPIDRLDGTRTFHAVAMLTTGAIALGALAAGIGFRVAGTNRQAEARQLRAELLTIPEPSGQPCSSGTEFLAECKRLNKLDSSTFRNLRRSERSLLGFVAAGSVTLMYGLYLAFSSDTPPAPQRAQRPRNLSRGLPSRLTPAVTPLVGGAHLSVSASF